MGHDCSFTLSGFNTVGTTVGLCFFFLILGAAPVIIYNIFGQRIKAFFRAQRGASAVESVPDAPADYPSATPVGTTGSVQGSYQTF